MPPQKLERPRGLFKAIKGYFPLTSLAVHSVYVHIFYILIPSGYFYARSGSNKQFRSHKSWISTNFLSNQIIFGEKKQYQIIKQDMYIVRLLSKKSWKFWFVVLELVIGYGEQDKSLKVKVKISWCLLFFQWIFGIGIFITKIYEKWIPTTSIIVNWWLYDHLDHWKLQANLRKKKMNMTKRNKALKIYTSKWNPLCIGQVVSLIHCGDESSQIC